MKFKFSFQTQFDFNEASEEAINEAVGRLRQMADELEKRRCDDIFITYPGGRYGNAGWWYH